MNTGDANGVGNGARGGGGRAERQACTADTIRAGCYARVIHTPRTACCAGTFTKLRSDMFACIFSPTLSAISVAQDADPKPVTHRIPRKASSSGHAASNTHGHGGFSNEIVECKFIYTSEASCR